jgi:hypothetical protein
MRYGLRTLLAVGPSLLAGCLDRQSANRKCSSRSDRNPASHRGLGFGLGIVRKGLVAPHREGQQLMGEVMFPLPK